MKPTEYEIKLWLASHPNWDDVSDDIIIESMEFEAENGPMTRAGRTAPLKPENMDRLRRNIVGLSEDEMYEMVIFILSEMNWTRKLREEINELRRQKNDTERT